MGNVCGWRRLDRAEYVSGSCMNAGEDKKVQLVMCGIMKDYGKIMLQNISISLEDGKVYQWYRSVSGLQQQLLVYNANVAVAYAKLIRRKLL